MNLDGRAVFCRRADSDGATMRFDDGLHDVEPESHAAAGAIDELGGALHGLEQPRQLVEGTGVVGVNWSVQLMALRFFNNVGVGNTVGAIDVIDYAEHALGQGSEATAVAYVETRRPIDANQHQVMWGVGTDDNIITASLRAVLSAHERLQR